MDAAKDAVADLRELRDTLIEMRRAAVRQAIRLDAPVEKYAAAVAELQAHVAAVDAALADETALAAAGARTHNDHRGIDLLDRAAAPLPSPRGGRR
jgi:hypothetical protein